MASNPWIGKSLRRAIVESERLPLILVALPLIHLAIWSIHAITCRPVGDLGVETDFFGDYVPWSREWMLGRASIMNGFKGPCYYLVLGSLSRGLCAVVGADYPPPPGIEFMIGKLISLVAAAFILVVVGWLAWRGAGSDSPACTVGVLVQLVVASSSDFLNHTYRAGTDLFALAVALGALVCSHQKGMRSATLAGGLAALAFLTRSNFIVILLPILVVIAARGGRLLELRSGASQRNLRDLVIATCAFGLVVAPWSFFLWKTTGSPFYSRNAQNAAFAIHVRDLIPVDQFMAANIPFQNLIDVLRVAPSAALGYWVSSIPRNLFHDLTSLLPWPVAALCVAGWAIIAFATSDRWSRRSKPKPFLVRHDPLAMNVLASVLIAGVGYFCANLPIFYGARFALPMLPSYAVGVVGLAVVVPLRPLLAVRLPSFLLLVGMLIVSASLHWNHSVRDERLYQPREILDLKRRLEVQGVHLEPGAVAVRKPHAYYWLGLDPGSLPDGQSVSAIVAELARRDTRYLYVGSSEMVLRRVLADLATPRRGEPPPPGLRLLGVGTNRLPSGRVIPGALYEVQGVTKRRSMELEPYKVPEPAPAGISHIPYLRAQLGRLLLVCGYASRAEPFLVSAAKDEPDWASVQEWAGDALVFQGDGESAINRYRAALDSEAESVSARTRLASVLWKRGAEEEARLLCREALEASMHSTLAELGLYLSEQEEFGAAIAPLTIARTDDPTDFKSSLTLGWIRRFVQRDSLGARADYLIALQHLPVGRERDSLINWLGSADR